MPQSSLCFLRWLLCVPLSVAIFVVGNAFVYSFNGLAASTWNTTEGIVTRSGFPLEYEFTVTGTDGRLRRETGTQVRHSFVSGSSAELRQRYPPGCNVTVWHVQRSETTSHMSVLEPGLHVDSIVVGLIAALIALLSWKGLRPVFHKANTNPC